MTNCIMIKDELSGEKVGEDMIRDYAGKVEGPEDLLPFLDALAQVIAQMFGPKCEVAISDIDEDQSSVLAIYNGDVTGRQIGSPLDAGSRERLRQTGESAGLNYRINYKKNLQRSDKAIKSSTLLVNAGGRRLSFCINYDCTLMEGLQFQLKSFLSMVEDRFDPADAQPQSLQVGSLIDKEIDRLHKPVSQLSKKDRLALIMTLKQAGLFEMRNCVPELATRLGVSRYTIYNYLKQLD